MLLDVCPSCDYKLRQAGYEIGQPIADFLAEYGIGYQTMPGEPACTRRVICAGHVQPGVPVYGLGADHDFGPDPFLGLRGRACCHLAHPSYRAVCAS
jgi:hypothetical protein